MKNEPQMKAEPSREQIALRAYQIWEVAGRPAGRDVEHWLQAQAELCAAKPPNAVKSVSPSAGARPGPVHSVAPVRLEPQATELDGGKARSKVIESSDWKRGLKAART